MYQKHNQSDERPDLSALLNELPPFIARNHPRFKELTGYSGRTFANFDSQNITVGVVKIRLGNCVAYERESLVRFLENRSKLLD